MYRPKPQEIYRHFKGKLYQVLTIAIHSETGEEMVVYQAMYGDFPIYCRPLWMFVSTVDTIKYPDADQTYRFELVRKRSDEIREKPDRPGVPRVLQKNAQDNAQAAVRKNREETEAPERGVMGKTIEEEAAELNMDPRVVAFLDADSPDERLQILSDLHKDITNEQLDVMSMALDEIIPDGDVYDRYDALRGVLLTRKRFESSRLRS